jgi:hypothetical protein
MRANLEIRYRSACALLAAYVWLGGADAALAASPFCPPATTPPVCAGRHVGDPLMSVPISQTQYAIIGMNPTTGTLYVFNSGALVTPGPGANPDDIPGTIGNIVVEPA